MTVHRALLRLYALACLLLLAGGGVGITVGLLVGIWSDWMLGGQLIMTGLVGIIVGGLASIPLTGKQW